MQSCMRKWRKLKKHKILRLCALARRPHLSWHIDNLLRVKIPQGSPYKKSEALIVAINVARWRLKTVGVERKIFSRSGILTSLVSRLEEVTQTR